MLGPIFARELATVPRRAGHYPARAALVGLLALLGATTWQAAVGFDRDPTLGETAAFGLLLFQIVAFVQLLLAGFFAALSAAAAVAQEKDRRTFVLLLVTDMRDHEIVLGKLAGALLPIAAYLLATTPVLAMLVLLGGIGPEQVVEAVLVTAGTAVAAGSLGGVVALWRDKTFQALALSVLFLVLYECLAVAVGLAGWGDAQAWLDPFAAMRAVLEPPPGDGNVVSPAYGFALVMAGWVVLLNAVGVWRLRKWNPGGEPIMQREGPAETEAEPDRAAAHAAPGAARRVWANPILWREIRTLAYGRRPRLVKLAFGIALGLIVAFAAETLNRPGGRPAFAAAYGLVPVVVLSLLLVAAQAVTSITSERDGGALDVLLVTDVSPREFVFGKLGGIAYNTKEYLVPPLLLAAWYAARGALAKTPAAASPGEAFAGNALAFVAVAGSVAVLLAFATVLGLHVSLRLANSRQAVANTLGTAFFLSVGTLVCVYLIVINGGSFANQWASFVAFMLVGVGGLLYVFGGDRLPSPALGVASAACPLAMFYCVVYVLIARPGTDESADPHIPLLALGGAFGLAVAAMLVPLLSEFDVTLGRTTGPNEG